MQSAIAYNQAERIEPLDELSRFTLATAYIAMDRRHWAPSGTREAGGDVSRERGLPLLACRVDYFYQWYGEAIAKLRTSIELDPDFAPAYDRWDSALRAPGGG